MGGGKGSSTTSVQLTPEQRETLQLQNAALRDVFMPAYTSTVGGAKSIYDVVNPVASGAANTAMGVAGRAGTLQENLGTGALEQGTAGANRMANIQAFIGDTLSGTGSRGLTSAAQDITGRGQGLTNVGGYGSQAIASDQYGTGRGMQSAGYSGLSGLFNPKYKEEQISAALQPAREEIREQLSGQNAMFGGAGGLGSTRMALANRNMSQLGEQRLASAAAQASGNVEAQRQAAANSMLGAGQNAIGQSAGLYQNILGQGANMLGQGMNAYGQILNAGQGANAAAQSGYGNLANLGQQGLTGAQQSAASRIGFAQTPQDVFGKYASVVFGVPQASTTANYAGTQGQKSSSKGFGF
jgi:hypothetical protein